MGKPLMMSFQVPNADKEIQYIAVGLRILEELDADARDRVLNYLAAKNSSMTEKESKES